MEKTPTFQYLVVGLYTFLVGSLTMVSDFEPFVVQELEDLWAEIRSASLETFQDDISVDELKIFNEEELANKAFEETFKGVEMTGNSSQVSEEHYTSGREDDGRISSNELACIGTSGTERNASASYESSNGSPRKTGDNGKVCESTQKMRKRKGPINQKNHTLEETYIAKVEQLARIKRNQDEDKAAARLHSFNGSCKAIISSEKNERMTSLRSTSYATKVRSSGTRDHAPVLYPEVVLCVEVYHNKRTWVKTKELLVLGRQPLSDLRDKIYCLTDEVMKKAGQYDASGYFLIEDVFCNDLRDPSAIDYSEPIFDWLRNSKNEAIEKWEGIISGELQPNQKELLGSVAMPHFKTIDMRKTRFCDLKFRLGAGYLYYHQGDCRHVIVIRDMRLIHPKDVQNQAAYPIVTFQLKLRTRKCSVCKIYRAEKVTLDDKWAPENPYYFCSSCYYLLHYVNVSLLYDDFSVYDYFHE